MIPAIKPERILSRCLFEVSAEQALVSSSSANDNSNTLCNDISRELLRLATTLSPMLTSAAPFAVDTLIENIFVWRFDLLGGHQHQSNNNSNNTSVVEIRDSRIASLFCSILEDRRVIRLAAGAAQVSWYVGGKSSGDDDDDNDDADIEKVALPLTDATTRAEEELRMNVDAELWSQALDRQKEVMKWLDIYAPLQQQHEHHPNKGGGDEDDDDSSLSHNHKKYSLERVVSALTRATSMMLDSSATASAQRNQQDPFRDSIFVGAFDNAGRPGLLCSLLPLLHEHTQPTARQVCGMVAQTKCVYVRALALLYVRYRCAPENIVVFFSNLPATIISPSSSMSAAQPQQQQQFQVGAPSIFAALGRPFPSFAASVLLDGNTLLQTSEGGGATTTMQDFSRALLLEDEVLEMWLPTYSQFATRQLRRFADDVALAAQQEASSNAIKKKLEQEQQQLKKQNDASNKTSSQSLPQRREREYDGNQQQDNNNNNNNNKSADSSTASTLLPGVKSIAQFAALMQEQARQKDEEDRAQKEREQEEENMLRRQFAQTGTEGDQAQRQEIFARQANSLRDRRRREVLERLRSAATAPTAANNATTATGAGGGRPSSHHQHHHADSSESFGGVVSTGLVNRSASFFGSMPPPYAALPPIASSTSVLGNAVRASSNPIAALCSTTTVGTDDVFICF